MISVSLKFNMFKANMEKGKPKWLIRLNMSRPWVWEEKENIKMLLRDQRDTTDKV